jgi:NOL1/NOP2/sun family putative RNA methylase
MKLEFKKDFAERYKKILGEEAKLFFEYCKKLLTPSIRVNTLKITKEKLEERLRNKGWKISSITWYKDALVIREGPKDLGNMIEHCLGYYYVQELASMIPPLVLDPRKGEKVLDLCAAPGSKTTQIAQLMHNKGIIVANDVEISRIKVLSANLQRCGVLNAIVTRMPGQRFSKVKQRFDRVLVDAPCTGEGAIRKDWGIMRMWNLAGVRGLSRLQKRLIQAGFTCLREGGTLVYSTCTLSPEENEEVIAYLLDKFENAKIERIRIPRLKYREGLGEWEGREFPKEVKRCCRIYPQDNDTEGFFIAKIGKD